MKRGKQMSTEWIISGNPNKYDVIEAFHELEKIDWKQSSNVEVGDTVYIYVSNTVRNIKFKCKVNAIDKVTPTIDDQKFNVSGEFDGRAGRYMELEMIEEFETGLFDLKVLENYGFKVPMGPVRVNEELKVYLDLVQKLLNHEEIIPDSHDGSYELMREVINAYSIADNSDEWDYKDLNLVYLSSVISSRHGIESKKQVINDSHLLEEQKSHLIEIISAIWEKVQDLEFDGHDDRVLGMFGTGFMSFKSKTNDDSVRKFIKLCIDIRELSDDTQIYNICDDILTPGLDGMGAAAASMVLHCLKPMIFPIFNGNMGNRNIFEYFGLPVKYKGKIESYISNCRVVKDFRDKYFKFKNYRVLDLAARSITMFKKTNIDYLSVLDYIENNREVSYSNPYVDGLTQDEKDYFLEIMNKGQNAVNEMKEMSMVCKEKFELDKCEPIFWLDGSKTKTKKYLWAQMKKSAFGDNPISISIFAEMSNSKRARYRISLEIKNDSSNAQQMAKYHSFTDLPIKDDSFLVYVSGSNEYGRPDIVEKTREEVRQGIDDGTYKKVQLCRIIEWDDELTNDDCEEQILEAVEELMPYYRYVIGDADENDGFWPTLAEYDPKLSADDYINVLTSVNVINKSWLDVLVYLYRMGGIGTCKQIANKYGNKAAHYNANGINIAKAVAKETGCTMSIREDNGKERYWTVLFFGKDVEGSTEEGEFIYKMREPLMEAIKTLEERGEFQDMNVEGKTEFDKNLILYGPPGTGKTYNSAIYAVAICDGKSVEELTDYDAVMKRYNELKKQGRVAFTTFHQSYGYEEFIEGIKPVVDEESKDVSYSVEPGVFKRFCEIARTPADVEVDPNACIWFMRLDDNAKTLKDTCFANETLIMDIKQDDDWTHDRFVEGMKIGDYVLSYAGSSVFIDAVGVIEGEAECDEAKESYQWSRKVKWTKFPDKVNVKEINGNTYLPNFSIAKMNHMKLSDLLRLLPGVNASDEEKPYVFIIDEINRGNISKIFGELITLIENTKREGMDEAASAILPYSNQPFSVPSNVYILGTMNTADRSIALMDTALRRRFQFVEMMPDADLLDDVDIDGLNVGSMIKTINKRIEFLYDREHTIGHAFFMGLKNEPTIEKLASIFSKSVIPLLQEYFYEDYQKIQLVLGDNAKKDEDGDIKFIKDEKVVAKDIFVGNVEDVIDLPEKSYSINSKALLNIESYKKIAPEQ